MWFESVPKPHDGFLGPSSPCLERFTPSLVPLFPHVFVSRREANTKLARNDGRKIEHVIWESGWYHDSCFSVPSLFPFTPVETQMSFFLLSECV